MGKKDKSSENTKDKLNLVIRSGKYKIGKYLLHLFALTRPFYNLGYKLAMRSMRNGQSKLVLIANNCPAIRKT